MRFSLNDIYVDTALIIDSQKWPKTHLFFCRNPFASQNVSHDSMAAPLTHFDILQHKYLCTNIFLFASPFQLFAKFTGEHVKSVNTINGLSLIVKTAYAACFI